MKSAKIISFIAALILIIFGFIGVAGSLFLNQLLPQFFKVDIFASLEFLVSGFIILLFHKNQHRIVKGFITLYFIIISISLFKFFRGLSAGNIVGEIAPIALLLFLCAGAAFVLLALLDKNRKFGFFAGILGLIISSAGFFSFTEFPWLGTQSIPANSYSTLFNASILFTVLGVGIFCISLEIIRIRWSLKKNVTLGLISGLTIMVLMSVLSHISVANLQRSEDWVSHTREVEYHLSRLSSLLLELELHRQNYLLTGLIREKELSNSVYSQIYTELDYFKKLTVDKASQRKRGEELTRLLDDRADLLQRTYDQYEKEGPTVTSNLLFLKERNELINRISYLITEADKQEKQLLAIRQKESDESTKRTFFIVPFGDVASLAILVWIFMLLNSEVTERLQSEAALRESEVKLLNSNIELKQKEQQLSELNESLSRSNQELAQFAYVASHDLQEPLRMIASYTQLLEKRYSEHLDQDAKEFINYAVDGANRMQKLINDLLEYSRVTTRGRPLAEVDLSSVLGTALANLQNKIQETNAIVTVQDELPCVMGDETQIMRVFQNLIDNAIKFRGNEIPRIFIKSKHERNRVIISIQDNGIGIDKKYSERIFVIFQRLHSTSVYPGTGMGLTICKKIIERHGGTIWFESEPGKGTTFSFSLTYR